MNAEQKAKLLELTTLTVENRKLYNGKRFSTYYEAQANLVVDISNATDQLRDITQALEFLWEKLKNEQYDEDYGNALNAMHMHALLAVEELITLIADLDKLSAGVVHEPKTQDEK